MVVDSRKKDKNANSEVIDVLYEMLQKGPFETEEKSESLEKFESSDSGTSYWPSDDEVEESTDNEIPRFEKLAGEKDCQREETTRKKVRTKEKRSASGQYVLDSSTKAVFQFWPSFDSTVVTENGSKSPMQKRQELKIDTFSTETEGAPSTDEEHVSRSEEEKTSEMITSPKAPLTDSKGKSKAPSNMTFLEYKHFFPRPEDNREVDDSSVDQEDSDDRATTAVKYINQKTTHVPKKVVQSSNKNSEVEKAGQAGVEPQKSEEQRSKETSITTSKKIGATARTPKKWKQKKHKMKSKGKQKADVEKPVRPSAGRIGIFGKGQKQSKTKAARNQVKNQEVAKEVKSSKDSDDTVSVEDRYAVLPKYRDANTYNLYDNLNESFSSGGETAGSENTEMLYKQYLETRRRDSSGEERDSTALDGKARQKYIKKMTKSESSTMSSPTTSTRSHNNDGSRKTESSTISSTGTYDTYDSGDTTDETVEYESPFLCGILDNSFSKGFTTSGFDSQRRKQYRRVKDRKKDLKKRKEKRDNETTSDRNEFEDEYSSDSQSEEEKSGNSDTSPDISDDTHPYSTE